MGILHLRGIAVINHKVGEVDTGIGRKVELHVYAVGLVGHHLPDEGVGSLRTLDLITQEDAGAACLRRAFLGLELDIALHRSNTTIGGCTVSRASLNGNLLTVGQLGERNLRARTCEAELGGGQVYRVVLFVADVNLQATQFFDNLSVGHPVAVSILFLGVLPVVCVAVTIGTVRSPVVRVGGEVGDGLVAEPFVEEPAFLFLCTHAQSEHQERSERK